MTINNGKAAGHHAIVRRNLAYLASECPGGSGGSGRASESFGRDRVVWLYLVARALVPVALARAVLTVIASRHPPSSRLVDPPLVVRISSSTVYASLAILWTLNQADIWTL